MAKKKKLLAVVVACQTTFGRGVIGGVIKFCREHPSWELYVEWEHSGAGLKRVLFEHEADGVISEIWFPDQLHDVEKCRVPIVDVSGSWDRMRPMPVHVDNVEVGRVVARHFMERGLRRFAYYSSYPQGFRALCAEQRREGFVDELRKSGLPCDSGIPERNVAWRLCTLGEVVTEQHALAKWLAGLKRPVGVMSVDDFKAKEVVLACHRQGIPIPIEVALSGVGNDDLACQICSTPLSSVDVAPAKVGYAAAEVIDRAVRTGKYPRKPVLIQPAGFVVRQSSDIFASEDKHVAWAMQFIQDHAHEPIQVKDILQVVPVCRRTLEKSFRKLVGRMPGEQICHVHVERAKKLLLETDLTLASVAEQSGFSSASLFSDIFRREVGTRPGQYRRKFRILPREL